MLTKNRRFGVVVAFAALLTLSTTACSGDTPGTEPAAADPEPADAAAEDEPDTDVAEPDTDAGEDGVYGGDLDTFGVALQAGTGADSFSVEGTTIRLHFGEGSVEDPSAHINCSAADQLLEDGHQAVMVYPDGEKNCGAEDAAGSGSGLDAADGAGSGSASLTIGDNSWEFTQVVCAFGEEETGVEGSEFNLVASNGSATVYAAIDPGHTYIEFNEPAAADPSLSEFITGIEPTIEIDEKNVYASASFITYEDTDTFHVGALQATCP